MVQRTTQPSAGNYHLYGGRGISTCERWLTYENFEADMGSTFSPELTLDRIDVDGDYSPENCRWATLEEQANNKRISKQIEWLGQSHTGPEWGRLLGIKRERINHRLRVNGWSINRALSEGADADKLISMATPSQLNELAAALEAERAGAMPKLCIRGHEFTTRNGRRLCRTCERDSQRRYDQRKRAKRDGVLASIEITS